jgi:hypothetical protein
MKKTTVLFLFFIFQLNGYCQGKPSFLFDVIINGFLFKTADGVFFQPITFDYQNNFIKSFNKSSFIIKKNDNPDIVEIMENVGNKLIVKRPFRDSLDKIFDTVYYFKTILKAKINYDPDRTEISSAGYGITIKDSIYSFGNLFTRVRVDWISPYDDKIRIQLANNYRKFFGWVPDWLKKRKIIYQE